VGEAGRAALLRWQLLAAPLPHAPLPYRGHVLPQTSHRRWSLAPL